MRALDKMWRGWLKAFKITLFLFLFLYAGSSMAQSDLSWDILSDVTFDEQYLEESDTYWLIPSFGDFIKLYEQQQVSIEGYLIVIDIDENFFVLSKYRPDSIVELQLDQKLRGVQTDQKVRVRGRLSLNKSDIEHFNYILTQASVIE